MPSETPSTSNQAPSPLPKPATSLVSEMLTPSELEQLRQKSKEYGAYLQKEYPGLRTT